MKGHKHSEETKKNMSETRLKRKEELGYINSPETIERMRAAAIGRNATAETRRKMSMQRGGKNNPSYGKSPSEKTRQKMSEAKRGEKHPQWKGGISFSGYGEDWTATFKKSIRQRDNYVCQECGIHQDELVGRFKQLDIHHIDYDKYNLNLENLISLCRSCHIKTNFNRDYWKSYYKLIFY